MRRSCPLHRLGRSRRCAKSPKALPRRAKLDAPPTSAKLWRREKHGNYVPSEGALFRTVDDAGKESVRSVFEALRIALLDRHGAMAP